MASTKVIRVKPGTVQLPHQVSIKNVIYTFRPHAEVPDYWADHVLKTQPHLFELVKGEPTGAYTWKENFKTQTLADLIDSLSDDEKGEVYELAQKLLAKRREAEHQEQLAADAKLAERGRAMSAKDQKAKEKAEREAAIKEQQKLQEEKANEAADANASGAVAD